MLRFSQTVRSPSLVMACGITPMLRRALLGSWRTSKPSISPVPSVISSRVVIMRMSVDLPAPLGPSNPKISPSATSKETPSTAVKFPKRFTMFLTEMAWASAMSPLYLGRRHQHLGCHSGHQVFFAVVHGNLEHNGFDVALAPVHIALGR